MAPAEAVPRDKYHVKQIGGALQAARSAHLTLKWLVSATSERFAVHPLATHFISVYAVHVRYVCVPVGVCLSFSLLPYFVSLVFSFSGEMVSRLCGFIRNYST